MNILIILFILLVALAIVIPGFAGFVIGNALEDVPTWLIILIIFIILLSILKRKK